MRELLRTSGPWHSTVIEAELSVPLGSLDPNHPASSFAIEPIVKALELRPDHRIVNPSREVWIEAGIAAGLMARLQRYGRTSKGEFSTMLSS